MYHQYSSSSGRYSRTSNGCQLCRQIMWKTPSSPEDRLLPHLIGTGSWLISSRYLHTTPGRYTRVISHPIAQNLFELNHSQPLLSSVRHYFATRLTINRLSPSQPFARWPTITPLCLLIWSPAFMLDRQITLTKRFHSGKELKAAIYR